jgi:hypothetical protein
LSFGIVNSLTDEQQEPFAKQFAELQDCIAAQSSEPYVLRKQAEAVELLSCEWGHGELTYSGREAKTELEAEAQRLRQQADELEQKQ